MDTNSNHFTPLALHMRGNNPNNSSHIPFLCILHPILNYKSKIQFFKPKGLNCQGLHKCLAYTESDCPKLRNNYCYSFNSRFLKASGAYIDFFHAEIEARILPTTPFFSSSSFHHFYFNTISLLLDLSLYFFSSLLCSVTFFFIASTLFFPCFFDSPQQMHFYVIMKCTYAR